MICANASLRRHHSAALFARRFVAYPQFEHIPFEAT